MQTNFFANSQDTINPAILNLKLRTQSRYRKISRRVINEIKMHILHKMCLFSNRIIFPQRNTTHLSPNQMK